MGRHVSHTAAVTFATSGFSLATVQEPRKVVQTAISRFPRLSLPIFAAAVLAWCVDPLRSAVPISLVPHVRPMGTPLFNQLWTMEII